MDELLNELQALIDVGENGELTEEQAQRMADLTEQINQRTAEVEAMQQRIDSARAAIEQGNATVIERMPTTRAAVGMQFSGSIQDVTDYSRYERTAYFKDLAQRSGIVLVDGEMTTEERAAFTHLTSNTGAVVPTETQNQIISLIDSSAVMFGDVHRDHFEGVYEVPRHSAIAAGDAASTDEGAAPSNEEQNTFGTVTLSGAEIKKTVKMSRKMQVQSIAAFEAYIVNETAARLSHAAELIIPTKLVDSTYGMPSGSKIAVSASTGLEKTDIMSAFGKLKTFNNPVPKGCIVYANGTTIWNDIVGVTDEVGHSFFIQSEHSSDPTVQGRIFGKFVKQDDALSDGVIFIGYPDLFFSNIFAGPDITPYIEHGTQKRCWDGYLLWDGILAVPNSWAKITIS